MNEANAPPTCNRRERRYDVAIGAVAYRPDGSRTVVELTNRSYQGCQLAANADLREAEKLRLVFPAMGAATAEIRWTSDQRAGACFDDVDRKGPESDPTLPRARFFYGSGRSFGTKIV